MSDGGRLLPMAEAARPPKAEPVFARVAIVGLGAIGASIGLAVRQAWPDVLIVGVDRKDILQQAVHLHAIDVGANDLVVAADVQLIVLAASDRDNARILPAIAEYVAGECVITDVGAAKGEICAAAKDLPPNLVFVDGTPDADAGGRGLESARPDLFVGRTWRLGGGNDVAAHRTRLEAFVRGLGATPIA